MEYVGMIREGCDKMRRTPRLYKEKFSDKIPRPPNAFMIYGREHRKFISTQFPNECNRTVSKRLGQAWRQLPGQIKDQYYLMAKSAEVEHHKKYPNYVYNPIEARKRKESERIIKGKIAEQKDSHFEEKFSFAKKVKEKPIAPSSSMIYQSPALVPQYATYPFNYVNGSQPQQVHSFIKDNKVYNTVNVYQFPVAIEQSALNVGKTDPTLDYGYANYNTNACVNAYVNDYANSNRYDNNYQNCYTMTAETSNIEERLKPEPETREFSAVINQAFSALDGNI